MCCLSTGGLPPAADEHPEAVQETLQAATQARNQQDPTSWSGCTVICLQQKWVGRGRALVLGSNCSMPTGGLYGGLHAGMFSALVLQLTHTMCGCWAVAICQFVCMCMMLKWHVSRKCVSITGYGLSLWRIRILTSPPDFPVFFFNRFPAFSVAEKAGKPGNEAICALDIFCIEAVGILIGLHMHIYVYCSQVCLVGSSIDYKSVCLHGYKCVCYCAVHLGIGWYVNSVYLTVSKPLSILFA